MDPVAEVLKCVGQFNNKRSLENDGLEAESIDFFGHMKYKLDLAFDYMI